MSRIELKFDEGTSRISGNPLGRSIYQKQVSDKINLKETNTIIFPKMIERVGESFVQGFFCDLVDEIGLRGTLDIIKIETGSPKLTMDIYEKLSRGGR